MGRARSYQVKLERRKALHAKDKWFGGAGSLRNPSARSQAKKGDVGLEQEDGQVGSVSCVSSVAPLDSVSQAGSALPLESHFASLLTHSSLLQYLFSVMLSVSCKPVLLS